MAWQEETYTKWKICWKCKWIFCVPWLCKERRRRFCCTTRAKQICVGFIGRRTICCDGRQHKDWIWCIGFGSAGPIEVRDCHDTIPKETEGCPDVVGTAPSALQ
jgi:hypothetical protein